MISTSLTYMLITVKRSDDLIEIADSIIIDRVS